MTQEALKLALEALENNKPTHLYCEDIWYSCPKHEDGCANEAEGDECNCGADEINAEFDKAITAIKEALAQTQEPIAMLFGSLPVYDRTAPPQRTEQEPVACKTLCELCVKRGYTFCANAVKTTPINTPPQRTWVGLTDEEVRKICVNEWGGYEQCRAIEAKLKQKNGYAEEKNT